MMDRTKPILLYDGDCRFCCRVVARWKKVHSDNVDFVPYQEARQEFPGISGEQFEQSVQLVLPSGDVFDGAEAVFRTVALDSKSQGWLRAYRSLPGFAWLSEKVYRLVSSNRGLLSKWIGVQ